MFERRLKVLLIFLLVASAGLAIRAAQIQIFQHDHWRTQAAELMKRDEFIETARGAILDRNGRQLAVDAPCTDACVDYRAIMEEPDPQWLKDRATENLKSRLGDQFRQTFRSPQWESVLNDEENHLSEDISAMWGELAIVGDKTPEQIDQIRADIVQRVEMRKRYIWWRNYDKSEAKSKRENSSSWYRKFLSDTAPDETGPDAAEVDKFEVEVGEETSPHMILHNIPPEIQVRLARQEDRFFCLSLVPSKYRQYPFGRAACNVLGYLGTARPEEIVADADFTDAQVQERWSDQALRLWPQSELDRYGVPTFRELRKYWPADQVGRTGIEALCEDTLRGTRGKIESVVGTDDIVDKIDAVPGKNVQTSIDVLLQQDIENDFVKTRPEKTDTDGAVHPARFNQHGAAVVIKVDTGEVLALVSNPGFDLNDLDAHYSQYSQDELNRPMFDRATELAVVPGSTVKPIVGSAAITDKKMTPTDTIQCRGIFYIYGKPQPHGRCWIYALCTSRNLPVTHGPGGGNDEHIGPDDMLTITDGIRVSCNVVFETIALKMGIAKLSAWYDRFGLGRRTGIGIEENRGLLYRPSAQMPPEALIQAYPMGIGEGQYVQATPIQMANVAATLARNGVWMRPRLVAADETGRRGGRSSEPADTDRVDLHLSPAALAAVQTGMREVCTEGGSGYMILPKNVDQGPDEPPLDQDPLLNIQIAGKTGSAQTGGFMSLVDHGPDGKPTGVRLIHFGDPGTEGWYSQPNTSDGHPEQHLAHAWFIGYAPADHPQIAFAVLVEYGEAGGRVAGPIAHDLLVDCIKHGYLSAGK
jgi:cell division protein FtsI/penicillin-binding protein 2